MAERKGEKVITVTMNGEMHHFGSKKAIYSVFTKEQLGISMRNLYLETLAPGVPLVTGKCTIEEGTIVRIKTNRKPPQKKINLF